MLLSDSVLTIPAIGYKYAQLLEKLSITTVSDLLNHFPNYYKDSSKVGELQTLSREQKKTVTATLISLKNIRLRNGKFIQSGVISDGDSEIEVTWFNQPFLSKTLKPPVNLILTGKLNPKKLKPQLVSPEFEIQREGQAEQIHMGRIVPVYSLSSGLFQKWLRTRINYLVKNLDLIEDFRETLPLDIREKYDLIELEKAFILIHFPEKPEDIVQARKRLGFDELLNIQKKLILRKQSQEKENAVAIGPQKELIEQTVKSLPFELTESQNTAVQEIHTDIARPHPMRRILQGDVGSGKTVVALLAALPVLENGLQVVLLAPTTILAKQHFETISKLLGDKYSISLVTSSTSKAIRNKSSFLIGTHAILANKDRLIENLGMIIVDEQHRFGVNQRRELLSLKSGGNTPHLLQLTATPIPRSIALTLFGDYDVSIILPPSGRKQVITYLVPERKREDSVDWIKEKLTQGGQAFWIFPMIEESEEEKARSLEKHFPVLQQNFIEFETAQVHGKMKPDVKERTIDSFEKRTVKILAATTVVEVGIDIPGANIIVIESAQQFGLAQLHQLRGRVGRNNQQAWCLLYYNESRPEVKNRLEYFASENNGIKIAQFDLQRRGPGEVYGTMQSGIPDLKIARFSNLEQLKQVQEAAKILYKK